MTDSIIFDLDGTLWDSTDIVAKAWNKVLAKRKEIQFTATPQKIKDLFGRPLEEIAGIIFPELLKQGQIELMDECCYCERCHLEETPGKLYPRLEETLSQLSEKYPLFIVSNCEDGYIEVFLKCTGFAHYFKDFVCPGSSGLLKGDNNKLIIARNHLKSPLYIGDTQGDADAAAYAGIPFIYAAYGFGQVQNYDNAIQSFSDLLKIL